MANESRALTQVGEWKAYVRRYPKPDPWWPLAFKAGFADVARTHPCAFGVWDNRDGTYTVAIKMEAMAGRPLTYTREVKRRKIESLLELRTLLITLANTKNTA